MATRRELLTALLLAPFTSAALAPVAARADDASLLGAALDAADQGDGAGARALAARARDPLAAELVNWRLYTRGDGDWAGMRAMLDRRPDWPRRGRLRREAERAMPRGFSTAEALRFFEEASPATATGSMRYADALAASGRADAAQAERARAWTGMEMSEEERAAFLSRHADIARRFAARRADAMLWRGEAGEARAAAALAGAGWEALAEARLALRARRNGVDALIARVPRELSNDPGLAYERFVWRARADRDAEAEQLLMQRTGSAASLGRPDMWARRRGGMARAAFRSGRAAEAYRIASLHHIESGATFADLEWLSGWIALRGLRDPRRAAGHFVRFWNAVETPISKGRAGYWLGRAYEASGETERSRAWYAEGARHPTSFYGQLAAEKIGVDVTDALAARDGASDWRSGSFAAGDTARAIRLLQQAGHEDRAEWFLVSLSGAQESRADIAAVGALALDIGRPDAAIRVAKAAARRGHVIMDIYYPVIDDLTGRGAVEPALALAIGRQESELDPSAVSHAGARGILQLMPATAEQVSRQLGESYSRARLTSDVAYNARLGKAYLAEMLASYGGATVMAAAAYNAGRQRVDSWIGRFGDPRTPRVDPIDWAESIPFTETRNYAQRVLEGLHVYRARLGAPTTASYAAALTRPQG